MEIGNNTQMYSTSFGMALRRPSAEKMERFVDTLGLGGGDFASKIRSKGLKQMYSEAPGGKNFDVSFDVNDAGKAVFKVIDNKTDKVVAEYSKGQEGLVQRSYDRSGLKEDLAEVDNLEPRSIKSWLKLAKVGAKSVREFLKLSVVNPKEALPQAMLTAAKKAQELDSDAIAAERARVLRNNSINEVNDIFEK